MVAASPNNRPACSSSDPALIELVTYSAKAMAKKNGSLGSIAAEPPTPLHPVQSAALLSSPHPPHSAEDSTFADLAFGQEEVSQENSAHAAPLPALRDRDLVALTELFQSANMAAIEADILENLSLRYPEPCWGDSPFDLLQDFL